MRAPTTRTARVVGLLVTTIALLTASVAVSASPASADGSDGQTPPGKAWVRAGHFVPGLGAARIELSPTSGGSPIRLGSTVSYGQASAYRQVPPGTYVVQIRQRDAASASAPMLSRTLEVTSGTARTIALLGQAKQPRLAVLTDNLTPPRAGTARVRILSGSASAPTISVMAVDGPTIATGVVLGETTGYRTVPQGLWTLDLASGGSTTSTQRVALAGGSVYTAIALDSGTSAVRLKVIQDAAGATATPVGGAATGEGGMARFVSGSTSSTLLAGGRAAGTAGRP